jgi:hypothetical protein
MWTAPKWAGVRVLESTQPVHDVWSYALRPSVEGVSRVVAMRPASGGFVSSTQEGLEA